MAVGGALSDWRHGEHATPTVLTDFTGKTMSVTANFEAETVESTAFGDAYRNYEQSFKNATVEVTYKYDKNDATIYGQLSLLYTNGTSVDFQLCPDGATATKPKITGKIFVTSFGVPVEIGNLLQFNVSFQVDGAVTFGTV